MKEPLSLMSSLSAVVNYKWSCHLFNVQVYICLSIICHSAHVFILFPSMRLFFNIYISVLWFWLGLNIFISVLFFCSPNIYVTSCQNTFHSIFLCRITDVIQYLTLVISIITWFIYYLYMSNIYLSTDYHTRCCVSSDTVLNEF